MQAVKQTLAYWSVMAEMAGQESLQLDAELFYDTSEQLDQMTQENDTKAPTVPNASDLQKYGHRLPTNLKISHYDGVILYSREDRRGAMEVLQRIRTEILLYGKEEPKVALFDEILPGIGMTPPEMLDQVLRRCNVKLLYITQNFCKDAWSKFSSSVCLNRAIRDPSQRCTVMPIFTADKYNSEYAELIPLTIQPLDGMDLYDDGDIAANKLREAFEGGLSYRKDQDRILNTEIMDYISKLKDCDRRDEEERNQHRELCKQQQAEIEKRHSQKMQERSLNNRLFMEASNAEAKLEDYPKWNVRVGAAECCPSGTPHSSGGSSFASCNSDIDWETSSSRATSCTPSLSSEILSMTVTEDHDEEKLPAHRNTYSAKRVTSDANKATAKSTSSTKLPHGIIDKTPATVPHDTPVDKNSQPSKSQDTRCTSLLGSATMELEEPLSPSGPIDGAEASMPSKNTLVQAIGITPEGISEPSSKTSSDQKLSAPSEAASYDKPDNTGPLQNVSLPSNTHADQAPASSPKENLPRRKKESKQGNFVTIWRETDKTTVEEAASAGSDTIKETHVPCENKNKNRIATSPDTSLNEKTNIADAGRIKKKIDAAPDSDISNKGPGVGNACEPSNPLQKDNLEEDDTTCSAVACLSLTTTALEDEKEHPCSRSFRAGAPEEENENRNCQDSAKDNEHYSSLPTYSLPTAETPSSTPSGSGNFKSADTSQSEVGKAKAENAVTGTIADCNSTGVGCTNAGEHITAPHPPDVAGLEKSGHESYADKNEERVSRENTNSDQTQDNAVGAETGNTTDVKMKIEPSSGASVPQSNKTDKETTTDDMFVSETTVEQTMYSEGPGRKPSAKTGGCSASKKDSSQEKTHSLRPASPPPPYDASRPVMVGRYIREVHHHYYPADHNPKPEAKHEPNSTIVNIHTAQSVILGHGHRVFSHQKVKAIKENSYRQVVRVKDEQSQQSDGVKAEESLGDDAIEEITGACAVNWKGPSAHREHESGCGDIYGEETTSNKYEASTGHYDESTHNRPVEKELPHLINIADTVQTEGHVDEREENPSRLMNLKEPLITSQAQESGFSDNEDTASKYMAATESDQEYTVAKSIQRRFGGDHAEEQSVADQQGTIGGVQETLEPETAYKYGSDSGVSSANWNSDDEDTQSKMAHR